VRVTQIQWHPATTPPDHVSEVLVLLDEQQFARVGHHDERWYVTEMQRCQPCEAVVQWAEMPEKPSPYECATDIEGATVEEQSDADLKTAQSKTRAVGELPNGDPVWFDTFGNVLVGTQYAGVYGVSTPYTVQDLPEKGQTLRVTVWAYLQGMDRGTNILGTLADVERKVVAELARGQAVPHG